MLNVFAFFILACVCFSASFVFFTNHKSGNINLLYNIHCIFLICSSIINVFLFIFSDIYNALILVFSFAGIVVGIYGHKICFNAFVANMIFLFANASLHTYFIISNNNALHVYSLFLLYDVCMLIYLDKRRNCFFI